MSRLILTYHAISDRASALAVSQSVFEWQVHDLLESGYRFETISSIIEPSDAPRRVAVCFDDGFESVAGAALPVLEREGLAATIFPIVAGLGLRADWSMHGERLIDAPMLDVSQLRELAGHGWEIGSHGMSHRCFLGLPRERAVKELDESRQALESSIGVSVAGFAYPQGCWSLETIGLVRERKYRWACSTLPASRSVHWNRWALPRVTIGPSTSMARFRAARLPLARGLRMAIPGRDSMYRRGHRHGDDLDSITFGDQP